MKLRHHLKHLRLDKETLKSLNLVPVGLTLALFVPFYALTWFLVDSVTRAKRNWGYITTDGQRIYARNS